MEAGVVPGDHILVLWDEDQQWYHAEVVTCDYETSMCDVVYVDGERQTINLKTVRIKISNDWKGRLRSASSAKQLDYVLELLLDIEDRIPTEGVETKNDKYWKAWQSKIIDAAKSGGFSIMLTGILELALQLQPNVTTPWWEREKTNWKVRLVNAMSISELEACVRDLMTNAVDWVQARQLFPTDESSEEEVRVLSEDDSIEEDDMTDADEWESSKAKKTKVSPPKPKVRDHASVKGLKQKKGIESSSQSQANRKKVGERGNQKVASENGLNHRKTSESAQSTQKSLQMQANQANGKSLPKGSRTKREKPRGNAGLDEANLKRNDESVKYKPKRKLEKHLQTVTGISDHTLEHQIEEILSKDGLEDSEIASADRKGSDGDDINETCPACQSGEAGELLLLCDGAKCDRAFHTFCLDPPRQEVPAGKWLCPYCVNNAQSRAASQMKTPVIRRIDAIIGRRFNPSGETRGKLQYLVKWNSLSHHHDTWVPEKWVLQMDRARFMAFQKTYVVSSENDIFVDERKPYFFKIDRIIGCRYREKLLSYHELLSMLPKNEKRSIEYLVKWKNVSYDAVTWEKDTSEEEMQNALKRFMERRSKFDSRACLSNKSTRSLATHALEQPKYISGGILHNYQLEGLKWLLDNYVHKKSVILADEMGLGKTIQAIAFMICVREEGLCQKPFLIIAPKSTLSGWERELQKWAPTLDFVIYQGGKEAREVIRKYEIYTEIKTPIFDVLVTSYETAMVDNSLLQKFLWSTLIVDEGHRIKNFHSKLAILLRQKQADFRLLLTGTPLQNTLEELFALLHFVDPLEFPDPVCAALNFSQVEGSGRDEAGIQKEISHLHDILRPRMLRRLKSGVLQGMLPGKKLVEVTCALSQFQRHLYVAILKKNYDVLNRGVSHGQKRSLNSILTDLKMCCNHPYLFPNQEPLHLKPEEEFNSLVKSSGKLQLLEKLLPHLKVGGHRILLFSQMTRMLDILEDFLGFLNYSCCRIDGSTSSFERQSVMEDFNREDSNIFVFLISTRAGGLGINLPSADTVIIYDPDFNPFVDLQAQARAHRIGQEKTVLVYQLLTKCSVEEKILQRSKRKLAMENVVMSTDSKDPAKDLSALLLHGASRILDEEDVESTAVTFADEDIRNLLNRDLAEQVQECNGYLGSVQGSGDEASEDVGEAWKKLLGSPQTKETAPEEFGRGKRPRRDVKYVEENASDEDDEYCPTERESESSSSSDDEDDEDFRAKSVNTTRTQQSNSAPIFAAQDGSVDFPFKRFRTGLTPISVEDAECRLNSAPSQDTLFSVDGSKHGCEVNTSYKNYAFGTPYPLGANAPSPSKSSRGFKAGSIVSSSVNPFSGQRDSTSKDGGDGPGNQTEAPSASLAGNGSSSIKNDNGSKRQEVPSCELISQVFPD